MRSAGHSTACAAQSHLRVESEPVVNFSGQNQTLGFYRVWNGNAPGCFACFTFLAIPFALALPIPLVVVLLKNIQKQYVYLIHLEQQRREHPVPAVGRGPGLGRSRRWCYALCDGTRSHEQLSLCRFDFSPTTIKPSRRRPTS